MDCLHVKSKRTVKRRSKGSHFSFNEKVRKVSKMVLKVFCVNLSECPWSSPYSNSDQLLAKIFPLLCQESSIQFVLIEANGLVPACVSGAGVDHEQL